LIEKHLQSSSTFRLCPLRGLFLLLDSRLRGNDGYNGKSGLKNTPERITASGANILKGRY
jgi:hypothetical protein